MNSLNRFKSFQFIKLHKYVRLSYFLYGRGRMYILEQDKKKRIISILNQQQTQNHDWNWYKHRAFSKKISLIQFKSKWW